MLSFFRKIIRALLPRRCANVLFSLYHRLFALGAMLAYGMPGTKLFVIGITGTKGKSSTAEMVNAILEEAGYTTALISTIRFKTGNRSRPNRFKMTMPGRGFIQGALAEAIQNGCTHAVVEITSEGARQARHLGLFLNALIFTNIAKEHIESHGSFEKYKTAKLGIGRALADSSKRPRIVVANADDELGKKFLELPVEKRVPFGLGDAEPYALAEDAVSMTVEGVPFSVHFPGAFTVLNALAAVKLARSLGIDAKIAARALEKMRIIPGRVEKVERGQDFLVIVDYAHTPDSLKALYEAYRPVRQTSGSISMRKLICILGNTGGGRDRWKRAEMGRIADEACDAVILTNEDPYDEDPGEIVAEMARGMKRQSRIIMDRREAIREAFRMARAGDAVLISGKGTDPYIMGAGGKKMEWSDSAVAGEELEKMGYSGSD